MLINSWEVWIAHTSYFINDIKKLDALSHSLCYLNFCYSSFSKNGTFFYNSDKHVLIGNCDIQMTPDKSRAKFFVTPDLPSDYLGETIVHSATFRYHEQIFFSDENTLSPPYIVCHLGVFNLIGGNKSLTVYPIVKIYATGIITIYFRIIGSNSNVSLPYFIDNVINAYGLKFDTIYVPYNFAKLVLQSQINKLKRPFRKILLPKIEADLIKNSITIEHANTKHDLTPLITNGFLFSINNNGNFQFTDNNHDYFTLKDIADYVLFTLEYVLRNRFPRSRQEIQLGSYWSARPHIHLINYQGQAASSKDNLRNLAAEFGCITARHYNDCDNNQWGKQFLPDDKRQYLDYNALIDASATLWAWSGDGLLKNQEWETPNNLHLIPENQVKVDFLEYTNMFYRRLLTIAYIEKIKVEDVFTIRKDLVLIENGMDECSCFGEVKDMLLYGLNKMGVNKVKNQVLEAIKIAECESMMRYNKKTWLFYVLLTILFGIMAVPSLINGLFLPLVHVFNLWMPYRSGTSNIDTIYLFSSVSFLMLFILSFIWYLLNKYYK